MLHTHEEALQDLHAAWTATRRGRPTLRLVTGPAGSGKTWVLDQWAQQSGGPGAPVWTVRTPAWVGALLAHAHPWLTDERDPIVLAAARFLAPQLAWPAVVRFVEPPLTAAQAMQELTGTLLRLASRTGGLHLHLEDVHRWSHEDRELFEVFWRRATRSAAPILAVLTSRTADQSGTTGESADVGPGDALAWLVRLEAQATLDPHPETFGWSRLHPLTLEGLGRLLDGVLGAARWPDELRAWVQAHAGGSPLAAEQTLRSLLHGGVLRRQGPVWHFQPTQAPPVPLDLQGLLEDAVNRLHADPDLWTLASALAAVEESVPVSGLAGLLGWSRERVQEEAEAAARDGHLKLRLEQGEMRASLTHPLLNARVRARWTAGERRDWYARAAARTTDPDRRATWARLGAHPQAAAWSRAALDDALAQGAWVRVERHAQALLDLGDPSADLPLTLATALHAQGRFEAAAAHVQDVADPRARLLRVRLLRATARSADALALLEDVTPPARPSTEEAVLHAGLLIEAGRRDEARARLEALLSGALPVRDRTAALGELGRLDYLDANFRAAYDRNVQAATLLDEDGNGRFPEDLSLALNRAGMLGSHLGLWEEAEAALRRSVQLLDGIAAPGTLSARHNNLGLLYVQQGRYREAQDELLRAIRLAQASGERATEADALHNLANVQFALGFGEDALASFDRCIALREEVGLTRPAAAARLYRADREARLGRPGPGLKLLESAPDVDDAYVCAARIHLCAAQPQAAREWLARGGVSNAVGEAQAALLTALTAWQSGGQDLQAAVEQAVTAARSLRNPYLQAEAALLAALLTGPGGVGAPAGQGVMDLNRPAVHAAIDALRGAPGHLRLFTQLVPALESLIAEPTPGEAPAPDRAEVPGVLRCLGDLGVEHVGRLVTWRGRRTRDLLALLLAAQFHEAHPGLNRDTLLATLWPEVDETKAEQNLRVTLRRLRSVLGGSARIVFQPPTYTLTDVRSDLNTLMDALARGDHDLIAATYRGPFAPAVDLPAVNDFRLALHEHWRAALLSMIDTQGGRRGILLCERLIAQDPLDIDAHLRLLNLQRQVASPAAFMQALDRSAKLFRQELGHVPDELADLRAP